MWKEKNDIRWQAVYKKVLKSKSIGTLFSILVIVVSGISTELSLSSTELHSFFVKYKIHHFERINITGFVYDIADHNR